jgi:hypothetical protein
MLQTTISKEVPNHKFGTLGTWNMGLGASLEIGVWKLFSD